ncbi:response regulator, partial [Klebsiella pneumoniae]|uniref:response regulator n=1 Tax=Klebsiella pneumoniae TaxID=573 RepID=UPI003EE17F59
ATFDIILMDCRMPEVDGCECVKLIHGRHGKRASPPIVAVTADVLARNRDDCLEAGMDDFLGKPFTLEELREKLTTWVKRRPRED